MNLVIFLQHFCDRSWTVTKQNRNVSKNRFSEYILKAIESVNVFIRVLNSIFRATLKTHHELTWNMNLVFCFFVQTRLSQDHPIPKKRVTQNCFWWGLSVLLSALHTNISMHFLHSVLCTFPKVLSRRIYLLIKSFVSWWSFLLFSWLLCVIQGWYCKEKLDANH